MPRIDIVPRGRLDRALWALMPGSCVLCHQPSRLALDLCAVCLDDLPWNDGACERCGLRLPSPIASRCAACEASPPPFSRTVAPLRYVDVVTDLVHALKFRGSRTHGRVLATILAASVERTYEASPPPSAIVPVPLSTRRLLARGQNQAAVIARRVGGELGIAVDYDSLRRIRHTAPQTGMTRRERLRNLAGAFDYRGALDGATVAIVDDVVTTGATVRAVARCLERHGAGDVHVWAVARTDRGDAT